MNHADVADIARLNDLMGQHYSPIKAVAGAHNQLHARFLTGFDHFDAVFKMDRKWLLNQNMLSGFRSNFHVIDMHLMRCGDIDGFDVRIGANILDVLIGAPAKLLLERRT